MSKIRRIRDFQHSFSFSSQQEQFGAFFDRFLESDLGKIYGAVPWEDTVTALGLKEAKKGPRAIFSPRGKVALMFLKHYSGCSDRKLVEGLNGNLDWQFFCGIYIGTDRLDNFKIVSEIRSELAGKLDIGDLQKALYGHWSPHMEGRNAVTMDATCYESHMRYPTNVKLLWECTDWLHRLLKKVCREKRTAMPRSRYLKWKRRYVSYSKMKRKTKKKRRALTRALLLLTEKFSLELDGMEKEHGLSFTADQYVRRAAAKKAREQQDALFHKGVRPVGRIVSLDRPYVRPIVRGKEKKPVEFGAKVHKFQLDGIGFIEHLSFDAFHEGIRFRKTVLDVQGLTRTKVKIAGGDAIYATNRNRRFATGNGIRTDFKRKGRAGKHEKQRKKLAGAITKERASRLEGSFGNDKEHYGPGRIRARTKATEILWIFFGIHTANALEIGRRMAVERLQRAA
ncbi:Transposase domain [Pricia antarctica]|uniref:Transposase domain n=1 Tax=Pricia antarctica TaxID=641691 RepID=A0A1G7IZD8_9FLAO|nr:transposase [Pricia antarctica]SDF18040.1 Transposase domain [Pricia antarctica]